MNCRGSESSELLTVQPGKQIGPRRRKRSAVTELNHSQLSMMHGESEAIYAQPFDEFVAISDDFTSE